MLVPGQLTVEKRATLTGHREPVYALAQGLEPHLILSCGGDGHLVEWNLADPGLGRVVARVPGSVYAIHYDEASGLACVGQNLEGLQWIDIKGGQVAASLHLATGGAPIAIFFIEKVDDLYLVGLSNGELVGVQLEDKPRIAFRLKLTTERLRAGLWLPDQKLFAIGSSDGQVRLIDLKIQEIKHVFTAHSQSVFAMAPHPQGRWLVTAGRDARINAFALDESLGRPFLEEVMSIPAHLYAVNHLALRPDGAMLASCSMDKSVKIWDPNNLQLIKVIDKGRHAGHGTSVNRVLWARFENLLVTCSDDRTLSVWHLSAKHN